jgi:hypothetical protein
MAADVANASPLIDGVANTYINRSATYTTPTVMPTNPNDLAIVLQMPYSLQTATWTYDPTWSVGIAQTAVWSGESLTKLLSGIAPVSETSTLSTAVQGWSAILLVSP